jgi:hypothetical protein
LSFLHSSGTRARWAAASEDTPITCTSLSTAWRGGGINVEIYKIVSQKIMGDRGFDSFILFFDAWRPRCTLRLKFELLNSKIFSKYQVD